MSLRSKKIAHDLHELIRRVKRRRLWAALALLVRIRRDHTWPPVDVEELADYTGPVEWASTLDWFGCRASIPLLHSRSERLTTKALSLLGQADAVRTASLSAYSTGNFKVAGSLANRHRKLMWLVDLIRYRTKRFKARMKHLIDQSQAERENIFDDWSQFKAFTWATRRFLGLVMKIWNRTH